MEHEHADDGAETKFDEMVVAARGFFSRERTEAAQRKSLCGGRGGWRALRATSDLSLVAVFLAAIAFAKRPVLRARLDLYRVRLGVAGEFLE